MKDTTSYDAANNRTSMVDNGTLTTYTYDANNRMLTETEGGTTKAYTYDANGNQLTGDGATYTYNARGQQSGYSKDGVSASYAYLPTGLRKSKTVGITTTNYVWDGQNMVYEYIGTNSTGGTAYYYGLTLISQGNYAYYLYNAHGDVVQLISSTGSLGLSYNYDAFGNEVNPSASDTNPFRYTGQYFDAETGTYYLRARYYYPGIGRFTQQDPIMDGLNWYVYCGNNPIMFIDPTGMIKEGDDKLNESIQIILNGIKKDGSGGLSLAWALADTDAERKAIAEMADKIRGFNANNINRHMILLNTGAAVGAGHTATLLLNESEQGLLFSYYAENGKPLDNGQMRIAFLNSTDWNNLLYNNKSVKLVASNGTIQSESYNDNLYLTVSSANGKKGLAKIANLYNNPGDYNLVIHNCDNMTSSVASAAGLFYDKRLLPNNSFSFTRMYYNSYWLWLLERVSKNTY